MTNQEKLQGNYIRFEKGQQNPIEFLESIGFENRFNLEGMSENSGYYIGDEGNIEACYIETYPTITVNEAKALLNDSSDLKVGDWVKDADNQAGILLAILPDNYKHRYIVSSNNNNCWFSYENVVKVNTVKPTKQDIADLMGLPVENIDFGKL